MIYKRFYITVIIRILLILATCIWFSEAIRNPANIYTITVVSALLASQFISLVHNINTVNRNISRFFDGIKEIGTSVRPQFSVEDSSFKNLSKSINRVADMINESRKEAEKQLKYFKFVIQNNPAGIIIADSTGNVSEINSPAYEILNIDSLFSLHNLVEKYPCLEAEIKMFSPGYEKSIRLRIKERFEHVLFKVTGFKRENEQLRIITVQNLTDQMQENELISWQKLTRVLTHEIMNSLTPIASLTEATRRCLIAPDSNRHDDVNIKEALYNLELIEERSAGIKNFVKSYKKVSQVPALKLTEMNIKNLVNNTLKAAEAELKENAVEVSVNYSDCPDMYIDSGLMHQVLINIIQNAIDATADNERRLIRINILNNNGEIIVEIKDNGRGIPAEELDDIFVPFYTTKKDGMGIGLSLSNQIMRLHRGSIKVSSVPGEETNVTLSFPSQGS